MFHFHVSICTCSTIYITTNTDVILGWGAMSATLPGQVSAEKMRALKAQTVPTEAFKKFEKKRKQALEDIEQNRKETAAQLRRVGEVLRNNADSKDESGKRPPKTGSAKDEKTKNKSGEKQKEKVAKNEDHEENKKEEPIWNLGKFTIPLAIFQKLSSVMKSLRTLPGKQAIGLQKEKPIWNLG